MPDRIFVLLRRVRVPLVVGTSALGLIGLAAALARAATDAPAPPAPAYVGIQFADAAGGGARVSRVVVGSPAERGKLEAGDVVVRFAGREVQDAAGLTRLIHAAHAGDRVEVEVVRAGDRYQLEVVVGDRPTYGGSIAAAPEPPSTPAPEANVEQPSPFSVEAVPLDNFFSAKPKLGVQLVETTPELRTHLGAEANAGVLISKVLRGTPAEKAGLEVGDLIVAVAGQPVATSGELVRALADRDGQTFTIEIVRAHQRRTVEVKLPEPAREVPTGPRV